MSRTSALTHQKACCSETVNESDLPRSLEYSSGKVDRSNNNRKRMYVSLSEQTSWDWEWKDEERVGLD